MHCGYIVKVEKLRKHPNADKLQIATFFGNDTCVNLETYLDDIGIYFPSGLQLSEEFCEINHLCRKKKDGTPNTGYLDENKRYVKAINLRGERSEGLYLPISCLDAFCDTSTLSVGDTIDVIYGKEICRKYIPPVKHKSYTHTGNKTRKRKINIAPLFKEHADTEQLAYNLNEFKPGDEIEITLKLHGTSGRTAHIPVLKGYKDSIWCHMWNWIKDFEELITHKSYEERHDGEPIYEYGYVSGTRRTVLENYDGGFYGSNEFRQPHAEMFQNKLWKGETVYYEIVSFTDTGVPIMGVGKVPKEAQHKYGKEMIFHYGLEEGSDLYVYRMTMTNEDGDVVEYTPDFMRYRCEQMGVKTVPVMWKGTIPEDLSFYETYLDTFGELKADVNIYNTAGEYIKMVAEEYYDGPDPIGKTHVREGVVVRILNRPKFCAYKHKNFLFKQISGIIIEQAENVDEEIASEM